MKIDKVVHQEILLSLIDQAKFQGKDVDLIRELRESVKNAAVDADETKA